MALGCGVEMLGDHLWMNKMDFTWAANESCKERAWYLQEEELLYKLFGEVESRVANDDEEGWERVSGSGKTSSVDEDFMREEEELSLLFEEVAWKANHEVGDEEENSTILREVMELLGLTSKRISKL
ncbi:uncharacterized protein LOC112349669 [Selaginella moellendorffii]|uniref:uncharacterized protein LOC112349669 n=1 Tax=Selaginella moellendorffii TaxID=88036 RepID=UPI000D1C739C|nr:uncharacterized protein LOC112349669 [Selaginella moellendorffii]|eukprot:XP_024540250.1 uncharacterized protein LOC112349669 [Selaginella moellendorffii]